jgi:hypothetical protein
VQVVSAQIPQRLAHAVGRARRATYESQAENTRREQDGEASDLRHDAKHDTPGDAASARYFFTRSYSTWYARVSPATTSSAAR